jgi:threonine/homoserine/homoserine lactone efflux protein
MVDATFWITTLIVVATPGTGVLYTVSAGLSRGRRAGLIASVGCTLGILPHLLAAVTGLAAVLHASQIAFRTLQFLGVGYLLYLAWKTFRDTGSLTLPESGPRSHPSLGMVTRGILVNLLNPKLTLFFFAFLPQFVGTAGGHAGPQLLRLGGIFMLATLVIFAVYGVLAAVVREHVIGRPRVISWLRRIFAGSYVALAGRLAAVTR